MQWRVKPVLPVTKLMGAVAIVVLAVAFAIEWLPNMRRKDRSLARFPEFAAYRAKTALLIPWLF